MAREDDGWFRVHVRILYGWEEAMYLIVGLQNYRRK